MFRDPGEAIVVGLIIGLVVVLVVLGALLRKRADQALTRSERMKDSIVASLTIHVAVLNHEGIVIAIRNRLPEPRRGTLAAPHSVVPGDNYLEVVQCALGRDTREAEIAVKGIRAVCDGEQDRFEIEYPYQRENKQHWFVITVTALSNSSERALVVHRNISKERWTEQAIRELSGKLIRAQEEERSRIARELHDDISQQLALLEVDLRRIQSGGSLRVDLERACKTIDDISRDVHRMSHHLHSTKLDTIGLVPALHGLCRELSEQCGISIESRVQQVPVALDKEASLNLYRVAQEALHNAVKHANAKRVRVELTENSHDLVLRITDDGDGFELGSAESYRGLGLISMQERMHSIGGVLTISSTLSEGTEIEARLPSKQVSGSGHFIHSAA